MFTDAEYDHLYPLACEWASQQEAAILRHGVPLAPKQIAAAKEAGVREVEKIRILAVSAMPMPDHPDLRAATARTNVISTACRGMAIGYGVMLKIDSWTDQELLAHQLVHVAQYERCGGMKPYLKLFFAERLDTSIFGIGPLELEARNIARKVAYAPTSVR